MRSAFTLLFTCLFIILNAQSYEFFAGFGVNQFFDKGSDDGHYISEYKNGLAYSIGLGVHKKKHPIYGYGATMKWTKLNGHIDVSGGSLGGGYHLKSEVGISALEIGLIPLQLSLLKGRLDLQLGTEIVFSLSSKLPGKYTTWSTAYDYSTNPPNIAYQSHSKPIDEDYIQNIAFLAFFRVGYVFQFGQNIALIPRVYLGYSLSNRFKDSLESPIKNRIGLLEVCLRKNIKTTGSN